MDNFIFLDFQTGPWTTSLITRLNSRIQGLVVQGSLVGRVPFKPETLLSTAGLQMFRGNAMVLAPRITPEIALASMLPQTGLDSDQVCLGRAPVDIWLVTSSCLSHTPGCLARCYLAVALVILCNRFLQRWEPLRPGVGNSRCKSAFRRSPSSSPPASRHTLSSGTVEHLWW